MLPLNDEYTQQGDCDFLAISVICMPPSHSHYSKLAVPARTIHAHLHCLIFMSLPTFAPLWNFSK